MTTEEQPVAPYRTDGERLAALEVMIEALRSDVQCEIKDAHEKMQLVEERATKADKFVRRVIYAAGSLIAGSLIAAVMLIYQAGGRAEASKAELRENRQEVLNRIEGIDQTLTEVRAQVKLLLETQLARRHQ